MSTVIAYLLSIVGVFAVSITLSTMATCAFELVTKWREFRVLAHDEEKLGQKGREILDGKFGFITMLSVVLTVCYGLIQARLLFLN